MKRALVSVTILLAISLLSCAGKEKSTLSPYTLVHTRLARPMNFALLRAPEKEGVDPAGLPVVVLLHGMGDNSVTLEENGVADTLFSAMKAGTIPLAHFILPDGEKGFYVNWYDGTRPYEDHIIKDIVRIGEDILRVSPSRDNRHIVGVSMGGQGAIRLGLTYPELFGSVTAFSTLVLDRKKAEKLMSNAFLRWLINAEAVFGKGDDPAFSDRMDPYHLLTKVPANLPQKFYLASGTDEQKEFHETMSQFKKALDARGVTNQYARYNGGHGWRWWSEMLTKSLSWTIRPVDETEKQTAPAAPTESATRTGSATLNIPVDAVGSAETKYDETIQSHMKEIDNCYKEGLKENPDLQGSITVRFIVDVDGTVPSVKIAGSTLGHPSTEECIRKAVGTWVFEKTDNVEDITRSFELPLQNPSENP